MNKVKVVKADTKKTMDDFVALPRHIYKDCAQYVPDLDMDVRATFDPKKNAGLEFSDIQPFVAYDDDGKCVGRIAAIINRRANERWNVSVARFGMIEFIDDINVSKALLNAVEEWGRTHGMKSVQGPMGISDFDKEGMLVDDFNLMGSMISIYNPPYYPRHMEQLGFVKEVDWVSFHIDVPKAVPEKFARVTSLVQKRFGLTVKKMTKDDLLAGGYGRKIFELLNIAYAPLFGFSQLSDCQIEDFLKQYIPIVDTRLFTGVEDRDGRLVGIAITTHSLSQALHKSRGKLLPLGWFHLLRSLKWKHEGVVDLMLIAVHPDYQGMGVNALFFADLIPIYNEYGITLAETGPQLEDNLKELSQWKTLNPRTVKRRRCYQKELREL
ncbi:MAG: N-acetyltransferase [Prevotella sp.]|nr:N-acetyltransferase [Prevotella sp.]